MAAVAVAVAVVAVAVVVVAAAAAAAAAAAVLIGLVDFQTTIECEIACWLEPLLPTTQWTRSPPLRLLV